MLFSSIIQQIIKILSVEITLLSIHSPLRLSSPSVWPTTFSSSCFTVFLLISSLLVLLRSSQFLHGSRDLLWCSGHNNISCHTISGRTSHKASSCCHIQDWGSFLTITQAVPATYHSLYFFRCIRQPLFNGFQASWHINISPWLWICGNHCWFVEFKPSDRNFYSWSSYKVVRSSDESICGSDKAIGSCEKSISSSVNAVSGCDEVTSSSNETISGGLIGEASCCKSLSCNKRICCWCRTVICGEEGRSWGDSISTYVCCSNKIRSCLDWIWCGFDRPLSQPNQIFRVQPGQIDGHVSLAVEVPINSSSRITITVISSFIEISIIRASSTVELLFTIGDCEAKMMITMELAHPSGWKY